MTIDVKMVALRCPRVAWQNSIIQFAFKQWNRGWSWDMKLKRALMWMSWMSESHWWYPFYNEVERTDSTTWFRVDNFKPRFRSGIFKCISWLNGSFFEGDELGLLKLGVKTYLMAPMSPLHSSTFLKSSHIHPDHLLLVSAPNLGPIISRWEINEFENCWYKSVRILEVLKLLFQQYLNFSSSQRDMSGPILGVLSDNMWSGGIAYVARCGTSPMILPVNVCLRRHPRVWVDVRRQLV